MKTPLQPLGNYSRSIVLAIAAIPFFCSVSVAQTVRYVTTTGLNTGTGTLANPYNTVLKAIAAASTVNGDTIKVATGTYTTPATTTISKSLVIIGTGSLASDVIIDRGSYATSAITGFTVTANNVTVKNMKVTNFNVGISNTAVVSSLILDNVQLTENWGAGFYSTFGISGLVIINSTLSYNGNKTGTPSNSTLKRGIYLLNGATYATLKFDNNTIDYNGLAGIEISSVSTTTSIDSVTITNNLVRNNGDAQISAWLGTSNPTKKAVLISNNTILLSDTSRYGIEVRNPAGNGKTSGSGSVVVSGNAISVSAHTGNSRDMAAIAITRRKETGSGTTINDQPQGVVVSSNMISNFQNPKLGKAFGIVLGGTGHKVFANTISNTEFSIQLQKGNTNYASNILTPDVPGQANTSYFDRDNSKDACVEVGNDNVITTSGAVRLTTATGTSSSTLPSKTTTNTSTGETFCSLQQAIDFKATVTGNTITANAGTFDEQVVISKSLVIDGIDSSNRVATFTGTAVASSGLYGIFSVAAQNVTIKNFKFLTDLSKINSAIISSGSASNLAITGNTIISDKSTGSFYGTYTPRNGISISASSNIIIQSNTVDSRNGAKFRASIQADNITDLLIGGATVNAGNKFLASVNHDALIRSYSGTQTVSNNIFNGGGVEVSISTGDGSFIVSNNIFDGTYAHSIPTAMVRIFTNASLNRTINFSYNQFINQKWTVSFENTRNVTLDHNDITAAYDSFRLISVNSKLRQSSVPATLETIDIKLTNNNLSAIPGLTTGNALEFLNFDSRAANNYISGNYVIGELGKENNFNANIPTFIKVSNLTGYNTLLQPFLDLYPEYTGTQVGSTTNCWKRDIFARHNRYFVNGLLKLASSFSEVDFKTVYTSIFDRQDDINIGAVVLMPTWSGGTSGDWSDNTNWSYQFPPAAGLDAIIYPQTYQPELLADAACDTLIILGGMTVKTGAYNLTVYGNVRGNGEVDGTTGSMILAGTTSQHLSGSLIVKNMVLNNPAGAVIAAGAGNKLSLRGKYTPSRGILATNDNLVLKSDVAGTASIGNGSGEYITGKVTIERFIPAHRAWRLLTTPVNITEAQTIHEAWQEGVNNNTLNYAGNADPAPGYGTHITLGNAAAMGFDIGINNNPSIKGFNTNTAKWDILPTTNIAVTSYPAYMLFVRGDRSINLSQGIGAVATNTILRSTGNIRMGDQQFTVAASGFTVMGNPFASPIDFNQVAKTNSTNIQDNFYVWDPKITGSNGVGGAVNLSWNGFGYDITPSSGGSAISRYLQSGSAFLARSLDGVSAGTLVVKEADKVNAGSDNVYRPVNVPGIAKLVTNLYSINADGTTSIVDGVLNSFGDIYSNAVDNMDAIKLGNMAENFFTLRDGKELTVERRQPVISADTIYYRMTQMKQKAYKFEYNADGFDNSTVSGFIEDNYLHTTAPVNLNGTTTLNFAVTADPGSVAKDRFRMVFRPLSVLAVSFYSIKAWQREQDIQVEWKVEHEAGTKQYEIERSATGRGFKRLATVPAKENNHGTYNWPDANAPENRNFYRVKMVELNGDTRYSAVVQVNKDKGKEQVLLSSKIITGNAIEFRMMNMPGGKYTARLINSAGQVLVTKNIAHTQGSSTETMLLNTQLANGIYLFECTGTGNKKITEQLVK